MTEHAETLLSLGSWIRRRRKVLDLTQAALAQQVGCAEVTIRKLEADVVRPSREIAERLAHYLDLPSDEHAVFVQVARGAYSVQRLPALLTGLAPSVSVPLGALLLGERLPRDLTPAPAPLPRGSRMPLSRNPLFVGRDAQLRQVAEALTARGTPALGQGKIAAATGLGGIGKTQLACEFVHRYGQYFVGGVFWLSFADPGGVPAEVAACGGSEGMQLSPTFASLPLDEQVRHVRTAWERALPRLLVFDTCEDEGLVDQWQPKHGGAYVLITSRRHHWNAALGIQPVPLAVLPRAESMTLLRTFRPDLPADDADLYAVADVLGDLPLALHLAGSFLGKYRHVITAKQYRERLHTPTILDDRSLRAAGMSPTKHVQHVARTFEQSYERLDPRAPIDALARTLLARAACFAPSESLPRWLLVETLDLMESDLERAFMAEDALTRLLDVGLLETNTAGDLRMHRLLVAFVRAVVGSDAAQAVVEATMLRVATDLNTAGNPRPLLVVQPHLRSITEAAQPRADGRVAGLYNALGYHLWQLGVYGEAQRCLEHALAIRRRVLGADHPDTAQSLHNLGVVLRTQGQYTLAQDYHAHALAIQQRVLGTDHPDTARSLHNLGNTLYFQGQYAEAQEYLEHALAIQQRVLGTDHPDTAHSLHNLGNTLYLRGQYAEAQGYLEQALAIRQRVLGTNHPDTTRSLNNIGLVLCHQGQYAEAQGYLEHALAIRQRVLGTNHPDIASSLHNVGTLLSQQGRAAEAQDYYEQAVALQERVLGKDHPDTAGSLRGLGETLHAQGETAQARQYLEQAQAIFVQRLGPEHPDTRQTRQMLLTLQDARDVGEPEHDP